MPEFSYSDNFVINYFLEKTLSELDSYESQGTLSKYAQDLNSLNFYIEPILETPWALVFIHWCALMALSDINLSKKLFYLPNNVEFTTDYASSMDYFKANAAWKSASSNYLPKPGDIVYYKINELDEIEGTDETEVHVGIIYKIDDNYIYSIAGDLKISHISSGSWVAEDIHNLDSEDTNPNIIGYGLPDWQYVISQIDDPSDLPNKSLIIKSPHSDPYESSEEEVLESVTIRDVDMPIVFKAKKYSLARPYLKTKDNKFKRISLINKINK